MNLPIADGQQIHPGVLTIAPAEGYFPGGAGYLTEILERVLKPPRRGAAPVDGRQHGCHRVVSQRCGNALVPVEPFPECAQELVYGHLIAARGVLGHKDRAVRIGISRDFVVIPAIAAQQARMDAVKGNLGRDQQDVVLSPGDQQASQRPYRHRLHRVGIDDNRRRRRQADAPQEQ